MDWSPGFAEGEALVDLEHGCGFSGGKMRPFWTITSLRAAMYWWTVLCEPTVRAQEEMKD